MANIDRGVTGNVPYVSRVLSAVLLVVFFATTLYFGDVKMVAGVLLLAWPYTALKDAGIHCSGRASKWNRHEPTSAVP
jgi:hypothetical protein